MKLNYPLLVDLKSNDGKAVQKRQSLFSLSNNAIFEFGTATYFLCRSITK